jgi:dihydrofolate reductase
MEKKNGLRAIMAVNNLGFIGLNGGLPWRCVSDFKHFKLMTLNCRLLVGHNTFHTLPPLKNRTIVLDDRTLYANDDIDWCIGGKSTYEKYASQFTELHISHIDDNSIGDTLFPDFKHLNPACKIFNYYFKP